LDIKKFKNHGIIILEDFIKEVVIPPDRVGKGHVSSDTWGD